jgi:hypothetical protein
MAIQSPGAWYTIPPGYRDAYLYSPAFVQALWPLGQLPWPAFQAVWILAQLAALLWLLSPLGWRRAAVLAPFFVSEVLLGNVYLFFAVALVAALGRAPGALALPLLTKVAPGVVGLWWLARREWRPAIQAGLATITLIAVSVALSPDAWLAWISFLRETAEQRGGGATWRLLGAAVVITVAARRQWAWMLAPALILACPVLGGYGPLAVLAAVPRLVGHGRAHDSHADAARPQNLEVAVATPRP